MAPSPHGPERPAAGSPRHLGPILHYLLHRVVCGFYLSLRLLVVWPGACLGAIVIRLPLLFGGPQPVVDAYYRDLPASVARGPAAKPAHLRVPVCPEERPRDHPAPCPALGVEERAIPELVKGTTAAALGLSLLTVFVSALFACFIWTGRGRKTLRSHAPAPPIVPGSRSKVSP